MDPVFLRSEKPVGTSDLPEAEEPESCDGSVSADPESCEEGSAADPELTGAAELPFKWADPCPPHAERTRVVIIRIDMRNV